MAAIVPANRLRSYVIEAIGRGVAKELAAPAPPDVDGVVWLQPPPPTLPDDHWLTGDERAVLAGLAVAKRRADWRLGRWTAKALLSTVLGAPPARVTVAAADDGAPEAFVDGTATGCR